MAIVVLVRHDNRRISTTCGVIARSIIKRSKHRLAVGQGSSGLLAYFAGSWQPWKASRSVLGSLYPVSKTRELATTWHVQRFAGETANHLSSARGFTRV